MKYKIHFLLLLAGALFFFGYAKPAEAAISWIPVGSGAYSDSKSTSKSAVVTDSNGIIYSAYADDSVGGKLTVKKFVNNSWQTVGTAGLSDSDVINKPFRLYFDAENNLSLAYIEGSTPTVTVSKFNGTSWVKSFSQTKSSLGITSAIFTSRNGSVFMIFSDSSDGNKLKAKKFNTASSTWDLLGSSSLSATTTTYFAADIDSSGNPYVAYVDQGNSNKVDIKKFNGSDWEDVGTNTVFTHSLNNENYLLVRLDGADTPYISYYNGTQYSYVFKFNGTDWAAVGSSFSYNKIYSLEFDSTNSPYIFYYSVMDLYNFSVKRFNGSTWELFGSARMLGDSGFYGGAYGTPSLIHNYYDGVDHFFIDYVTPSTSNERRMLRYTASRELYINNSLSESAYNDGTVGGQLDIYLTNDSFTSVGKTLVLGKDYSINSPAGLTPTLSVNSSGTIATLKFSGSATYHDQENSISNLAINFTSSAFLGGTASSVLNNPTPNSSITFFNYAYANASIVAGLTSDEVNSSSISFAPYPFFATGSSTPYVVYTSSDGSAVYHIKVKKYNGSTWGLAATSIDGVNANFPKASFNSAGEMYLSYLHNSNLVVKKYNGSAWDTVGSSTLPTSLYRASEPVFDSTGNPYIFYVNSGLTAAYVIKFDGSSWVNVGGSYMAQFLSSGSYFHTLAFDSKNNLHVVHRTNGGKPVVSKFDGASWSTLNSGELSSNAFDINIAVGTSDVPYISYTDAAAGKIIVKNFVDGHWITLGDYVSGSSSSYATLRIGSDGVVYVVYSDGVNSGKATLKKFNGTNWELVGQAGFSSEAISVGALDMAISGSNEPYVSHNSSSVKGVVTKMILPPVISNLSAEPTQDQADLSWKVDTGEISNYVVKYKAVERSTWTIFSESPLSGTETTITGLQPSTQYESAVSAVNTLGYYSAPLIVALTTSSSTPPTDFSYSSSSDVLTVGVEYSTSPTVTGKGLSYTVTPSLPEGLLLNQTTGVISGTPTASSKQAVYTVTVSNSSGNLSFELTLSVTVPAPSAVSFSNSKYEFILGLEDNYGTGEPTVSGGQADFFSVSPSLPAGLSINETTGVISGTPTATSSQTTYTVTAENDSGSVSCSVDILILFTRISYFTEPQTFIVNNNVDLIRVSLDDLTYMSPSSVFDSFTVNPEFPAGLTLDSKSGAISGTPTATSSETTYTITASNSAASTTTEITFSVTVNAPDSFYYGEIPSYFLIGSTINSLSPSVNGYYLSYSVSPGLPEGLTIDPETGVISGTPTATSSEATYTITVTNDGGSASVDLTFSVIMAEIEYSSEDYYLKKWDSVEIAPIAFSGLSSCSYELPSGLNVDESTGSIVGQPDTSSSLTSYTITCGGKSASINIAVEEGVMDGYYYNSNGDYDYLVFEVSNQAEDQSFALSELYGDNLSFKISPALPSGLNLNSSNGEISGYLMDTLNFKEYEITASNHVASSSHSVKIGAFRTGTSLGKTFDEDYKGYDLVRFNSKGVLYSALNRYNDKTGEYIIEVKKYSPGSGWQLVGNSLVSKTLTILQDFVFDRFDTPTVLYSVDNKSSYNVYVIQYLNSTWQNIGDAISSSNYYGMVAANDNIYFVDSLGNAYVSNNGSWNQIDDGSELNIGGEQFDIIASGDGSLYAAYYSNYTLYVKKYDGESWSAIKTEENIDSPKLELTTDGTLYLSGRDFNNKEDLAAVFKYKNNIWTRLGKETPVYSSPSLTIVNNDPVISFTDSYGVTFIKYDAKNIEDPTMLSYVVPDSSLVSLTSHDSTVAFSSSYKNVSDVIRQYEIISNTGAGKKVNPNELPALVTSGTISPRNGNASSTTAIKFNQRITVEADNGASILIPEGVEMTASSTFKISDISAGVANVSDLSAIDVAGSVSFGLSLQGLTLNQPITITIPVSGLADGIVLPVYTRYAGTSWTHITDCTLSAGVCSFQVDHLSEFATGETVSSQSSSSSSVIAPTCSSVTYSEFSNLCVGGYNYRNFVSQSPNNCSLSAAQIEAARRLCGVTEENNSNSEVKTDTGVNLISRVKQEVINLEKSLVKNISKALSKKLKGRILLQVEEKGEAWYVNPIDSAKYFLGSPTDAFALMRKLALGISNVNFDSFGDKAPVRLAGRILLKVEDNGKAYYVDPNSLKMYYLGRPADAFNLMRSKGLGITNANLRQIVVGE